MLVAIIFGFPILIATPIAIVGASVWNAGRIEVHVRERTPEGSSVDIMVPAAIVPVVAGIGSVCSFHGCDLDPEAEAALDLASAAMAAMAESPDGVYVEVRSVDEIVLISKRDGTLHVEVDTPEESVRASIPLAAARSALAIL
jgi:hypothetical protein